MSKKYSLYKNIGINSQLKAKDKLPVVVSRNDTWPDKATARRETAAYIQRITTELCTLAAKVELEFLVYLLDMARVEAHDRIDEEIKKAKPD